MNPAGENTLRHALWRQLKKFSIFILLFLGSLRLPARAVINTHDEGSQAALEYYLLHHLSFGRDIIQNVGPFGFLAYPEIYTGFLDMQKMVLNVLLTGFTALLATRHFYAVRSGLAKLVWVGAILLMANHDALLYLLAFMLSLQLIAAPDGSRGDTILRLSSILALALLALMKSTFFFIALLVILFSVCRCLAGRRYALALSDGVAFIGFCVVLWLLAGQPIAALIDYPKAAIGFSAGYNEAMTEYESTFVAICGVASLLLLSVFAIFRGIAFASAWDRMAAVAVQLMIIFVVWKHGFVRADSHVQIFFSFAIAAAVLMLFSRDDSVADTGRK